MTFDEAKEALEEIAETLGEIALESPQAKELIERFVNQAVECQRAYDNGQELRPVVHGRWKIDEDCEDFICGRCSECGFLCGNFEISEYNFCPICGADMRKEVAKEIHVGDEVIGRGRTRYVVTHITIPDNENQKDLKSYAGICGNGELTSFFCDEVEKTGRTFPQIVEALNAIQKENNQ